MKSSTLPEILAPAGDRESFLAAIGAGADAIYVGLKKFSARKQAPNFSPQQLLPLIDLAHARGIKVYLTLNTLIFESELKTLNNLLKKELIPLGPDGIIFQDLSLIRICREAGYEGEIHLSTLGAWQITSSMSLIKQMNIHRVVLPRELTIDEVKQISENSHQIGLEVFVHGALCYGISGRCYWSSMLGGKSGLRGRCVQPCRRIYKRGELKGRFFSCRDLSVDVLAKILLKIPNIICWKIEGRKKGPHYVFYTTRAYKLLRDSPSEPEAKKMALEFLKMSLGRATTHYNLLSHRRYCPIDQKGETASGLFIGRVGKNKKNTFIRPNRALLPLDILRIGYQDQQAHRILKVSTYVPRGKKYLLPRTYTPEPGTEVFLIDRREPDLLTIINGLQRELSHALSSTNITTSLKTYPSPHPRPKASCTTPSFLRVILPSDQKNKKNGEMALWLYPGINPQELKKRASPHTWIWITPYIWPEEEEEMKKLLTRALDMGFDKFILNSLYHLSLFPKKKKLTLWLGPFANLSNSLSISIAREMGIQGVIISPEMSKKEILSLPLSSPLPLGIVIKGIWPFCISRTKSEYIQEHTLFFSPKGEGLWLKKLGQNYFVFPNWILDLSHKIFELKKAGFSLFVNLDIPMPVSRKKRKFEFNWNISI